MSEPESEFVDLYVGGKFYGRISREEYDAHREQADVMRVAFDSLAALVELQIDEALRTARDSRLQAPPALARPTGQGGITRAVLDQIRREGAG